VIDQGATSEAKGLLNAIAPEVERHFADHKQWLPQSRERIARRRAKTRIVGEVLAAFVRYLN
jgi:hypothetical protein